MNFGFNIFRGFGSTGGQSSGFPIDFADHRCNSAAATAQPVTLCDSLRFEIFDLELFVIAEIMFNSSSTEGHQQ